MFNLVFAHVENLIDVSQHGFIKNKSTLTNLSIYTKLLAKALDDGHEVHSIYTDFTKAFDMVNLDILLQKLRNCGFDELLIAWFESYLKGRLLRVVFAGGSSDSHL